jgi:hypothetical protein
MMIGQCSWDCSIIVWILFSNVQIEHEWVLYTHTIYIAFHVLVLKVAAIYFEPYIFCIFVVVWNLFKVCIKTISNYHIILFNS